MTSRNPVRPFELLGKKICNENSSIHAASRATSIGEFLLGIYPWHLLKFGPGV